MDNEQIKEIVKEEVKRALRDEEKHIGFTVSATVVFLAFATMLSHQAHTREMVVQAQVVDDWSYHQAKHGRAHDYGREAELVFLLSNEGKEGKDLALKDYRKSIEEECTEYPPPNSNKDCTSPVKNDVILQALKESSEKTKPPEKAAQAGQQVQQKHAAKETEKKGAAELLVKARTDEQKQDSIRQQALVFDIAEFLLEISIVFCSFSLLADSRRFWKASLVSTALGVTVLLYGLVHFPSLWTA